ncbi:MAG TPA: biotin/lipoyl-containing protein [Rhodothermales bacterium]
MKYSAKIGAHSHTIEVVDGRVTVDGAVVETAFHAAGPMGYTMIVDGRSCRVLVEPGRDEHFLRVTIDGRAVEVDLRNEHDLLVDRLHATSATHSGVQHVRAPMPGLVRAVHVETGDVVEAGHGLLVLEAMKMENELRAEASGVVRALHVAPGQTVEKNQMLIEIGAAEE